MMTCQRRCFVKPHTPSLFTRFTTGHLFRQASGGILSPSKGARSGSSCQDDVDRSENKESDGQTDGDIEEDFFHPTTALVDRTLAPKDTTQARSLGLQQNSRDESHRDDDLNNV